MIYIYLLAGYHIFCILNHCVHFGNSNWLLGEKIALRKLHPATFHCNLNIFGIGNSIRLVKCITSLLESYIPHTEIQRMRRIFPCCRIIRAHGFPCFHINQPKLCCKHNSVIIFRRRINIRIIVIWIIVFLHRHFKSICQCCQPFYTADFIMIIN